jgi:hypothetical protein
MNDLIRNLAAGVRLALFLPLRPDHFRAGPAQFAVLVGFNFVLWIAAAAFRTGLEGEFDPAALAIYLSSITLVLATALLVTLCYRAPERLLLGAVALVASDPVFELAGLALPSIAELAGRPRAVYIAFLAWGWLVSMRVVVVCFGWRRPAVFLAALVVSAMTAVAFYGIPKTDVWLAPEEDEEEPAGLRAERLFHLQGQLIERDLGGSAFARRG